MLEVAMSTSRKRPKKKIRPLRVRRNLHNEDAKRFWAFVDWAAKEVATWPEWMKVGTRP